eukprot:COSAG02_NODE_11287_length_1754_cov_1.589728_1_plen_532_part_10
MHKMSASVSRRIEVFFAALWWIQGSPCAVAEGCSAGAFLDLDDNACVDCAPGFFSPAGATSCIECAPGTTDHDASPVSPCELCPRYSFGASARTVGGCALCPDDTNAVAAGATSVDNCTIKPDDSTMHPCTQVMCSIGHVPIASAVPLRDLTMSSCCQHSCATWGATNSCPSGSTLITDQADLVPSGDVPIRSCCSIACPPGTTVTSSGRCELCPAGTISTVDDARACTTCEAGTFAAAGSSVCTACDFGQVDEDLTPATPCSLCSPGTFAHAEGRVSCESCSAPNGQWRRVQGEQRVSECDYCPPGFFSYGAINTTSGSSIPSAECQLCPSGSSAVATDSSVCNFCSAGRFDHDGFPQTACLQCPRDTFSTSGSTACMPCARGKFAPAGSTHADNCTSDENLVEYCSYRCCAIDFQCPLGTVLKEAAAGHYIADLDTANIVAVCCESTCASWGSSNNCTTGVLIADHTPAGYTPQDTCCTKPCQAGSAASFQGRCETCPAGTFSKAAATRCDTCGAGGYAGSGSAGCDVCP